MGELEKKAGLDRLSICAGTHGAQSCFIKRLVALSCNCMEYQLGQLPVLDLLLVCIFLPGSLVIKINAPCRQMLDMMELWTQLERETSACALDL